jgi:hypothetical protein
MGAGVRNSSQSPEARSVGTRLESVIERLLAQRASIDHVAELVAQVPGPVLELGLGSGRTYDHLRDRFRGRKIFVFDRDLASHPTSRPDAAHFIQGDFRETLPTALTRIRDKAAVAHCDIGSYDLEASRALAAAIAPLLCPLMAIDGIVFGDQPMPLPSWTALPLPTNVAPGRYFIYRIG